MASSSSVGMLRSLHARLDEHFRDLYEARQALESTAPVFALEHDLPPADLDLLRSTVRAAVCDGLRDRHRLWWLPFVVYAAESGYDYAGNEYWTSFEHSTPGWRSDQRHWIKSWFRRFATEYGAAVPTGAFAAQFTIIGWPITHSVLPTYLQRQLAHLLFEFSGAFTSNLLDVPPALGRRLASRASSYSERFRIFCENTTLLGQVAAALLSGKDAPSPYLTALTLERIVGDLSEEQQARNWLKSAQQSANRARGFRPIGARGHTRSMPSTRARTTDPRLFLRFDAAWQAYAELSDLTPLTAGLPEVYDQLRTSRGLIDGGARQVPPCGLLYPGQEVHLATWPRPDVPFLQLERGDDRTNHILASQCGITKGPWWLFRCQGMGLAVEVKGKFVRPGHDYVLVGAGSLQAPRRPWCTEVGIGAEGVRAYNLDVPEQVSESDKTALSESGIGVTSHVAIRPVGVVASRWDGEGDAEWLAGEPAILGVRTDLQPHRCRLEIGGAVYFLGWSPDETELLFSLEGIPVGGHPVNLSLLGDCDRELAAASLIITIRDPQTRPEGASTGEGIRMLAAPARPTLGELWDERAVLTIDGPADTEAELSVILRGDDGLPLVELKRTVGLPLSEDSWSGVARKIRKDRRFREAYDAAESCLVTVSRDGVGFASLTCERGFQALRWRFVRSHSHQIAAYLIDRTDGGSTKIEFFDAKHPLVAVPMLADNPVTFPPGGGLAIARSGDSTATVILPADPNDLFGLRPSVSSTSRNSDEIRRLVRAHAQWLRADLRADLFAAYQQHLVGEAIVRAIGTLIGGYHWAQIEGRLATAAEPADYLEQMQGAVGVSASHKELAAAVGYSLHAWRTPSSLVVGFDEVITPHLPACGIASKQSTSRFLLTLACRPGSITSWEEHDADFLIEHVLQTPVLYRAARFAVVGARALHQDMEPQF